jgi:hypothetical protein
MTPIFYLFGSTATEFYMDHEAELSDNQLAEAIAEIGFGLSYYDEFSHPSELLCEYDGYEDFVEITEELYDLLTKKQILLIP